MYALEFLPRAQRSFLALTQPLQVRVARELERLTADPYHPGTKALRGGLRAYRRARVGDLRIVYEVQEARATILAVEIAKRSTVYNR